MLLQWEQKATGKFKSANHLNFHVLRQPLPKYYLLQDIE